MYITKNEIKAQLKDELKCPKAFIDQLDRFGDFDRLKEAIIHDEKCVRDDLMKEIREEYRDYCKEFGLDGYYSPTYG